jgi:hypothetical protein
MQLDKGEPLALDAGDTTADATTSSLLDIGAVQPAAAPSPQPRRTSLCHCASGKRYKHCCGLMNARSHGDSVRHAVNLMNAGEAVRAAHVLASMRAADVGDCDIALETAKIYLDLHELQLAESWLGRALELAADATPVVEAQAECSKLLTRRARWRAAGAEISDLLQRLQARACAGARRGEQLHIVCKLDTIGGTERRALNLCRQLSARTRTTLWSTAPALAAYSEGTAIRAITADAMPSGGTLILVGTYFDCGDWLRTQPFERVVICHNLGEQHASLLRRLRELEANPSNPQVELTLPSALFRETCGLPGRIEYSPVDVDYFHGRKTAAAAASRLRIGRHGRAYPWKFHPNDPAFFRSLIAKGHAVRILGGEVIADAFAHDGGARPELLPAGALDARDFLADLDVFVYRKHPHLFETGGTVILEAMAMQLPVIAFAGDCGYAEVIVHGENGFIVASEAEALTCVEHLLADPALRVRIGAAARETVVALMREQAAATLEYYAVAAT